MRRVKRGMRLRILIVAAACVIVGGGRALAQSASNITLWVDAKTGQVFTRPGRGREPMKISGTLDSAAMEQQIEQNVAAKTQTQVDTTTAQLREQNASLQQQVTAMKPAWNNYTDYFFNKVRIGTLLYGDYRFYTHTGFGPQELTQIIRPGPGNDSFNSFDITRTYLNFFFTPTQDILFRVTPNIYLANGTAYADKFGKAGAVGSNLDGSLDYRLKYAYLQYAKFFDHAGPMKGDTVTFGSQPNPLVGWEEDLYNYRYVNLTPWNYLSLSSSQVGLTMQGPIKFNGLQYVDYDIGGFNDATFHAFEQTNNKQVMGRVSVYPFGAEWRFDGLGLTGFYDYGYGNTTPDQAQLPATFKAGQAHFTRIAALLHYSAENWGIAGEFDAGRNAFTTGNFYSGSGPEDAFSVSSPAPAPTVYAPFNAMATAILNNGQAAEEGWDFFGHYHIADTPLTLFGMFQQFLPNTNFGTDPLDFQKFVVGVSYQINEYLRFAVDSQNLLFYHGSTPVSVASLKPLGFSAPTGFKGSTITDSVPRDTHAIFANLEFNY